MLYNSSLCAYFSVNRREKKEMYIRSTMICDLFLFHSFPFVPNAAIFVSLPYVVCLLFPHTSLVLSLFPQSLTHSFIHPQFNRRKRKISIVRETSPSINFIKENISSCIESIMRQKSTRDSFIFSSGRKSMKIFLSHKVYLNLMLVNI
jgi:hypothetical protein